MTHPAARLLHNLDCGSAQDRLTRALALYAQWGPSLLAQDSLREGLATLRGLAVALENQMRAMDLGSLCTQCAAQPGGGCCGASMAENTDSLQILINLLLGIEVRLLGEETASCGFLGPRGCLFPVKPVFCLNYNCSHILAQAAPHQLDGLYQRAAAVLRQQHRIEGQLIEALIREEGA